MSRWNVARLTSWRSSPVDTLSRSRRGRRRMPEPLEARWLLASDPLVEVNLASNQPGTALVTDPSLGYAWGMAASPGSSGAFSISDTSAGRSNSYSGDVAGSPFVENAGQAINVPLATGQVYNGNSTEFATLWPKIPPGSMLAQMLEPTEFLYASLDGTIYGYSPTIGHQAVQEVSVKGASFTGLTLANNGTEDRLYATDFLGGKIDVFAPNFSPVTPTGSFTDPDLPAGYKPFNIQALDGELYVSYASLLVEPLANTNGALPPVPAPGGVVDAFDANGNFVGRIASGSALDQPWGMALAPASFGQFAGDLLVANHGDGKINVFDPTPNASGAASLGALSGADGNPFVIDGLWGLAGGNGDNAGDSGALYFTAGGFQNLDWPLGAAGGPSIDSSMPIASFSQGLLGTIQVTGTNPLVADGTDTSVLVGKQFSGALAAFGSAELPSPTANAVAKYTATIDWGDGSSTSQGTLAATGNGGFVVEGQHTYSAVGADNYTVTINDGTGNSVTATGSVQVSPVTLVATALSVTSQEPTITDRIFAEFIDTGGVDSLRNYSATIDWGDGTTSAGAVEFFVVPPPGTSGATPFGGPAFYVVGRHTYAAAGDYTFGVTISDTPDSLQTSVTGTVDIAQPTLVAKALPVTSQGLTINNAEVAGFSDTGGPDQVSDYNATIAWGDGATTTGTVVAANGNNFFVSGSHTYAAAGGYTFTVAISDTQDSLQTSITGAVDVAQPTLVAKAQPVTSQELSINNDILAEFLDTGGLDPQTNYSATIDWGDGTTSTGTINMVVADPPGTPPFVGPIFLVEGSHTYATAGDYTFTVSISDTPDTLQTSVTGTVQVAQATLAAKALPVESHGLNVNNATLASFVDTGGSDPLSNYIATINWGDGTSTAGTVTGGYVTDNLFAGKNLDGFFAVSGSHTYAKPGDYTFTVTISDTADSLTASATSTIDVAQATLVAHALPVQNQGLKVNNASVATFFDTGGSDPLSDYTASIDWGDGSTTAGTVTSALVPLSATTIGGSFFVSGSHTYAAAGDYTLTVTISDTHDSLQTSVIGTLSAAAPTLKATALPVVSQGLNVDNATLASFIDTGGADASTDYSATIDWGDGTTTAGTIHEVMAGGVAGGANGGSPMIPFVGGIFFVEGSHTYAAAGNYTFTVTISDTPDTLQITVTGTVSAAQPMLTAHAMPVDSKGLTLNGATLADFIDTGGADLLSDYTATINWGDGQTSSGTFGSSGIDPVLQGTTYLRVHGSHTYSATGEYTFTVAISDTKDNLQTTVTGTAHISPAPLLAVGVPVVVSSGLSVNGAIVAAFADDSGGDALANYSATIDWGDGSSTAADSISGSGNSFIVTGSHTYSAGGDYALNIAINDQDGSTANVVAHAFINSPVASFVTTAFQDVLHRASDDSGLSYWTQQIAGGTSPSQFASDLAHSSEYYATNVIDPAYKTYLGRAADANGLAYWTAQMQQGLSDQQLDAEFIASPEFYANSGGTNAGWINALYQTVLGRPADSAGMSYWASQLAGGAGRSAVAIDFAASQEHVTQAIQNDYFTYLGRNASASEVNYWVAQFEHGASNEDIVSGFVGSPEFYKLHS